MHGETRPVGFEVTVHGAMQDPQGQSRVGLEIRGTLSRGEFGLRWQQALETGGVVVGDEVRVSADISAVCTRPDAGRRGPMTSAVTCSHLDLRQGQLLRFIVDQHARWYAAKVVHRIARSIEPGEDWSASSTR